MVPIDGPVRENVGLLGSPAFEIPRMVTRDCAMNASFDEQKRHAGLRQKNRHNLVTALHFLASRWMAVFITFVIGQAAFANYDRFGILAFFAGFMALIPINIVFFIVLERASLGFKRLQPQLTSIYDPYFWFHERHWKMSASSILPMFAGTPFRGMLLRALGMKVGAKLFDCSQTI
jgi:non-ribosomal peptide synthetase-like protein